MSKLILCPNTDVSPDIRISDNGSCNKMIWENGKLIKPEKYDFSNLEFICESLPSNGMTDYAVSDMGCSVVSERFRNLLVSLGVDNIQYYKATVLEREGEQAKEGYYAANIVGLVDCIDRDASQMRADYDDDGKLDIIYGINKLVLTEPMPECGLLIRAYAFTRLILIDDSLKDSIETNGITGVRLISPERWDGFNGEI